MATDPLQYYIGKGIVSFTPAGGTKRDLGNVPTLEFTPNLEKLEHKSSRTGVSTTDRTIILSKGGTVRLIMEEWNIDNLALALLGSTPAAGSFDIFANNSVNGELEFVSANEVGPTITMTLYNVTFNPSGTIGFLSDEWGQLELEGDVGVATSGENAGKIGTMDVTAAVA